MLFKNMLHNVEVQKISDFFIIEEPVVNCSIDTIAKFIVLITLKSSRPIDQSRTSLCVWHYNLLQK